MSVTASPIRFLPMSECHPTKNDRVLLWIKGLGCVVGSFSPGRSGTRYDGTIWRIEDSWYVDGYQGGDFYEHADPDLLGWYPIDETMVILP